MGHRVRYWLQNMEGVGFLELLIAMFIISVSVLATSILVSASNRIQVETSNRSELVNSVLTKERDIIMRKSSLEVGITSGSQASDSKYFEYKDSASSYNTNICLIGTGLSAAKTITKAATTNSPRAQYRIYTFVYPLKDGGSCTGARLVRIVAEKLGERRSYPNGIASVSFIYINPDSSYRLTSQTSSLTMGALLI